MSRLLTSKVPSESEERLASCLDTTTARLLKANSALPFTTGLSLFQKHKKEKKNSRSGSVILIEKKTHDIKKHLRSMTASSTQVFWLPDFKVFVLPTPVLTLTLPSNSVIATFYKLKIQAHSEAASP